MYEYCCPPTHQLTYLSPYNSTLAYTTKINIFPLHFNNFLEENFSKSPSFLQLLPVVMPSVLIIQDVKWKSPWYINPLTSRTTVSPSCSNFNVLLTLIVLELISNTNTLVADLKLTGCIIAEEQWGHFSWVSCSKDPSHLQVDFGVSSFSYNTSSSLSLMYASEYSHLVHSGLEMATQS